jgi:membrane-associated protease RseP (regulator of RpoE activity)
MSDTQVHEPPPPTPVDAEAEPEELSPISGWVMLASVLVATGLAVFSGAWAIPVVIFAIVVMIFMHELGHYLTAKSAGMKVTEFFLGFGPRIWSFRRGETEYGLKVIPAGAYVKIIGMNNLEEVDPADESRTYRAKSYPRRLSVAVAGSAMHFLMAIVLAFVALVAFGQDDPTNWRINELSDAQETASRFEGLELDDEFQAMLAAGTTPAEAAGLEEGDRIVGADDQSFDDFLDVREFILGHPGEDVTFVVQRDGDTIEVPTHVGLVTDGVESEGFLGFSHEETREPLGVVDATQESFSTVGTLMSESVQGIGRFFSPSGLSSFADSVFTSAEEEEPPKATLEGEGISTGPSSQDGRILSMVGAVRIGAEQTGENGLYSLLLLMIVLNVFIGLFNLIPLLPFDGGHVAIATYERIREIGHRGRYHADLTKMLPVAYGVVLFMVTIGAMAIYADVFNWQDFG